MSNNMKKRWISLYVENQVGVLSKISGLFSGKSYNLDSLTVGTTEDPTISRMTIATVSDDETFEQIKKQLNRLVEVIKVIDFTDVFVRMKEILYVKVRKCTPEDKVECFQIAETFKAKVIDYGKDSLLLEFVQTATKNDAVIKLMKEEFKSIEVVRGGKGVALLVVAPAVDADGDAVGAHGLELLHGLGLHALHDGDDGHHRRDADEDGEDGQGAAALLAPDGLPRHLKCLADVHCQSTSCR